MRKTLAAIVGSMLFLIVVLSLVSGDFLLPYSFAGNIYDENGENAKGANITITNCRTHDQLSCTTTQNGEYQLSASSFASGYKDGDICKYVVIYNNTIKDTLIEIDALKGGTIMDFYFGAEKEHNKENKNGEEIVVVPSFSFVLLVFALIFAYLFKKGK